MFSQQMVDSIDLTILFDKWLATDQMIKLFSFTSMSKKWLVVYGYGSMY